jgi:hypothetical protein
MKTPPNNQSKAGKTINADNTDVIDLTEVLSQGTEFKEPANNTGNSAANESNINPGDEKTNTSNTVNSNDFEEVKETVVSKPIDPVEDIPQVSFVESAKTMVMTLDLVGQIAFPIGYKASMFKGITREEWRDLKDTVRLYESGKITETNLTEEQFLLVKQFKDYAEICKEVDFTPKEIDMLTNPLALMLQKYGMKSGPEATFLFAVVSVMGPRIMPMFIK